MKSVDEIKNEILKAFDGLKFDEESHTYTINNKKLLSSTTYISKFSDKFNGWFASEGKAKKILEENPDSKRTGAYYRKRWDYVRDEAANMGSRVHMFAECYPDFDLPMCNKEQGVIDFFNWLPDHYIILFQELRVYDEEYLRAGTIDGLALNTKTGKLVIFDFKTNNRNILEYYGSKKLKSPFKDLRSTKINKYSLQLSDYQYMIEKATDFKVEGRWVIWLYDKNIKELDADRSSSYKIEYTRPSVSKKYFKLFKLKCYKDEILNDLGSVKIIPSKKKYRKKANNKNRFKH